MINTNIRIKIIRDRLQMYVSMLHLDRLDVGFCLSNINFDFFVIFVNNFNNTSIKSSTNCKGAFPIER